MTEREKVAEEQANVEAELASRYLGINHAMHDTFKEIMEGAKGK